MLYKNKDKFGIIKDNFIFKLDIFYDKCQFVGLFLDVYLKVISIMSTGLVQTYFYTSYKSIILFDQFYQEILLFFQGLE